MSKGKFAVGALIGAAAGFFAGVLSAPKSGKETRADIAAQAEDIKVEATEVFEKCSDDFCNTVDCAKHKASQVVDDVKAEAEDLRRRTEKAVEGAKKGFFEKNKK